MKIIEKIFLTLLNIWIIIDAIAATIITGGLAFMIFGHTIVDKFFGFGNSTEIIPVLLRGLIAFGSFAFAFYAALSISTSGGVLGLKLDEKSVREIKFYGIIVIALIISVVCIEVILS